MKKRAIETESIIHCLPEDVLRQIVSHLDHIDLNSTSLVCKLFCSLSSPFVRKLTLRDPYSTYSYFQRLFKRFPGKLTDFQRLFKRFPGVTDIHIHDYFPELDYALLAISKSDLNLERLHLPVPEAITIANMSTSKVINCIKSLQLSPGFYSYREQQQRQITEFINLFPSLIELDFIKYVWTDKRIQKVTSKLPNLQRINLRVCRSLSDNTLATLSSNCPKLESVEFQGLNRFTPEGLYKFFCKNPQLSSVGMSYFYSPSISELGKCIGVLKNLSHLSLRSNVVQDTVLIALTESRPPLKSLTLGGYLHDNKYTMDVLYRVLSAFLGLESLDIKLPQNYNIYDAKMSTVVKRLSKLKHIKLSSPAVCQASLFSLVQNCPLLETICFRRVWHSCAVQVCDHDTAKPTKKNYSIKSISVNSESDNFLVPTVESYCPNLRKQKQCYELAMSLYYMYL